VGLFFGRELGGTKTEEEQKPKENPTKKSMSLPHADKV